MLEIDSLHVYLDMSDTFVDLSIFCQFVADWI